MMMRRFIVQKLRERNPRNANNHSNLIRFNNHALSFTTQRSKHSVAVQLDYYMSPQFAGVASALVNGLYSKHNLDVSFLPICPVGLELERVRQHQDDHPSAVTVGSVEQNIFIPTLWRNPALKVTTVAAMFRRSPLCIASTSNHSPLQKGAVIGAHEDTVELMQRIFPGQTIVASPRATKVSDLMAGKLQGIQAYQTTEVLTLRRELLDKDASVVVVPLEGANHAQLGYCQTLFCANEVLECNERRPVVTSFLEATFQGWEHVISSSPSEGVEMVEEARKMLQLDDENNDHWHPSRDFSMEMLQLCNDFVKETREGDRLGVIVPSRFDSATQWLLSGDHTASKKKVEAGFGLDASLWQPSLQLLAGNQLALKILEDAKASATLFCNTFGRKPSLAVITVGELSRYKDAERRVQLYSNGASSWFTKTSTGEANGFDLTEINLDQSTTTTEDLLSKLYSLKDDYDGIQLMWPLPEHIDNKRVYNAIDIAKDVDGIHYVGQCEIGNKTAYPPVTPAAVFCLLEKYNIDVEGKKCLVVGRSPIVGSPLAHMLRTKDAIVTIAHSKVPKETLEQLTREADIVFACAGQPGLLKAEWINGGVLISVGATFDEEKDCLVSDVEGDISQHATHYSPVPGGVGPLSKALLLKNVAHAAWDRMNSTTGQVEKSWSEKPSSLSKTYHFDSYSKALEFAKKVDDMSTIMDHHANMKFTHACIDGVDVEMELFTFEANGLTEKDYDAAQAIDTIADSNEIRMIDYSYNLKEDSIAKYPASPRGSSKLLQVSPDGRVTHHPNFSEAIVSLTDGSHIVFNESRVLDARLFVKGPGGGRTEMMILDMGTVDLGARCYETDLHVMIRADKVQKGDQFDDFSGHGKVEVVEVKGVWVEDEKSSGNGTECVIRILPTDNTYTISGYLDVAGSVPIPPYFQREAEESDKEAYNNVYASGGGSVAAPTAGLHFTDATLAEIGNENISFLSLHVGAGTFKPVVVDDARDHAMHAETFSVSVLEIKRIIDALKSSKDLTVVGTTSARTLESLFWCGVKRMRGIECDPFNLTLDQFEWIPLAVGEGKRATRVAALTALIDGLNETDYVSGSTSLMIVPGSYEFKIADHLITNFHAPDSTLMLLVSAFLKDGNKVREAYEDAQEKGFKFLSYGDACILSRPGGRGGGN